MSFQSNITQVGKPVGAKWKSQSLTIQSKIFNCPELLLYADHTVMAILRTGPAIDAILFKIHFERVLSFFAFDINMCP